MHRQSNDAPPWALRQRDPSASRRAVLSGSVRNDRSVGPATDAERHPFHLRPAALRLDPAGRPAAAEPALPRRSPSVPAFWEPACCEAVSENLTDASAPTAIKTRAKGERATFQRHDLLRLIEHLRSQQVEVSEIITHFSAPAAASPQRTDPSHYGIPAWRRDTPPAHPGKRHISARAAGTGGPLEVLPATVHAAGMRRSAHSLLPSGSRR